MQWIHLEVLRIVAIGTKCKVTVHSYDNETPSAFTVHAPPHAYPFTYTHTDRGRETALCKDMTECGILARWHNSTTKLGLWHRSHQPQGHKRAPTSIHPHTTTRAAPQVPHKQNQHTQRWTDTPNLCAVSATDTNCTPTWTHPLNKQKASNRAINSRNSVVRRFDRVEVVAISECGAPVLVIQPSKHCHIHLQYIKMT